MKDLTLADYIKRIQQEQECEKRIPEPQPNPNNYKIYPEQQGDADHKINPYGSH